MIFLAFTFLQTNRHHHDFEHEHTQTQSTQFETFCRQF